MIKTILNVVLVIFAGVGLLDLLVPKLSWKLFHQWMATSQPSAAYFARQSLRGLMNAAGSLLVLWAINYGFAYVMRSYIP